MTSTRTIRLGKALALTAVVAGTVVSAVQAGIDGRPPDVRDAAAALQATVPDAFERYAATHPYGMGPSSAKAPAGRPPDVRDAADAVRDTVPDAFERYAATHPYGGTRTPAELVASHFRHEDALYRSRADGLQRPVAAIPGKGFDWSDYGVGIGTGIGIVLLFAGGLAGVRHGRDRVQAA